MKDGWLGLADICTLLDRAGAGGGERGGQGREEEAREGRWCGVEKERQNLNLTLSHSLLPSCSFNVGLVLGGC